jgi:hypothetical protein
MKKDNRDKKKRRKKEGVRVIRMGSRSKEDTRIE